MFVDVNFAALHTPLIVAILRENKQENVFVAVRTNFSRNKLIVKWTGANCMIFYSSNSNKLIENLKIKTRL